MWAATGDAQRVAEYRTRAFGIPALLCRLLTDDRMREVWEAVSAVGSVGSVPHTRIFAASVIRAWLGPWREERWSATERAKWQREVADLAERLAAKLHGTNADDFLNLTLLRETGVSSDTSDLLRSLARHAGQHLERGRKSVV